MRLGPIQLRYYSLMFAFGFIFGFWMMRRVYKRYARPIEDLDSLLVYLVLGTMIGARLGHVIFYEPGKYFSHPIEILKIWEGGLASHGGVIGVLTAVWLYCRKHPDQPFLWLVDKLTVPVALVSSMIRLGNFFNSEILGRPTDVAWAIVFERAPGRLGKTPLHPAMLYESAAYLLTFFVMLGLSKKERGRGFMTGAFLVLIFGARFVIEFFKLRQVEGAEKWILSQGQFLSIPLLLLGVYLMLRAHKVGTVPLPDPVRPDAAGGEGKP